MICPTCGYVCAIGDAFCTSCGDPLSAPTPTPVSPTPTTTTSSSPAPRKRWHFRWPKSGFGCIGYTVIIIVTFAACSLAIFAQQARIQQSTTQSTVATDTSDTPVPTDTSTATQKPLGQPTASSLSGTTWIGYQQDCNSRRGDGSCDYRLIIESVNGDTFKGTECADYNRQGNFFPQPRDPDRGCAPVDGNIDVSSGKIDWTTKSPRTGNIELNHPDRGVISYQPDGEIVINGDGGIHLVKQ